MKKHLFAILTILAGVALFGGLFTSAFTGDGVYFVYGYPIAATLLFLAPKFRTKL